MTSGSATRHEISRTLDGGENVFKSLIWLRGILLAPKGSRPCTSARRSLAFFRRSESASLKIAIWWTKGLYLHCLMILRLM
ncbi:hypothetical protein EON64_09655 [archaeon]|nr:MAG: hypothetical protein EON64_09655 [archaeon]